ncbi:hypothetical protein [Algibacter pacificus]|uniref:hypothetical protein n=1 Tax=Algibacter pacificus TaxID=2599389 RepID=UPI0011CAA9F0|nr:hypothetical protein [Algibacter pacificus]
MKKSKKILYAIFKNQKHLGNELGTSKKDAIKFYLIASGYGDLTAKKELSKNYSAEIAINGVHHYLKKTKKM